MAGILRNRIVLIALTLVVILAFALRVYKVTEDPPSLNWDEVSIGYNAYSILKTGRDEWGQAFPLHFKAYGEYKLPVQIYASIPGIAIFGLNEFGVRITPVIYGTLTVLLLYFLAKELTKSSKVGLVSAFLLATSPWHIHLTRASFESSFSVFWVMLGILMLYKGLKSKKYLVLSAIPLALAVYTYNSARVFTPMFILAFLFIYRKELLKMKKTTTLMLVIFGVCMLPLVPFSITGEVANRYKLVSIVDDAGLVPRIDEARNMSTLPSPVKEIVHNRYTYLGLTFISNYLAHFTPSFLFIDGAPHKQHHVPGTGQMYLIQAPFIFLGLYYLFRDKKEYKWLLLAWVLLAFIPVAITRDSIPHALRTLIAAPPYAVLTAIGVVFLLEKLKSKSLKWFIAIGASVILILEITNYQYNFYTSYPLMYSRDWQYGYKQVVDYIGAHYDQYDEIVFTRAYGEPHMFTLFFLGWDPGKFQSDPNLNRFETFDWVRVLNFDKFYFPDLGDAGTQYQDIVKANPDKKLLFIGKPGDFPDSANKLFEVNFLDGNQAFQIVKSD